MGQILLKVRKAFGKIEKRIRFVVGTLFMTGILLVSTFFFFDTFWLWIPIFVLTSYLVTFFTVLDDIEHIEWLMLFILPVVFTIAFYVFYFLFPVRWLTRLPFLLIYAVSIYALLLTSNIFNVGVEKSLQLYRAAFSVNYFYQTLLVFLLFNILFSLRANVIVNMIGAGIVIFPLALQLLWTIKLDLSLSRDILSFSLFLAYVLAQVSIVLSFMPFRSSIVALILTATYYCLSGLVVAHLDSRLFPKTVREYLVVLGIVLFISMLTLG